MKILWLINVPLKEVSLLIKKQHFPYGSSWIENTSRLLSMNNDIQLSIALPQKGIKNINVLYGKNIKYYLFPSIQKSKLYTQNTDEVLSAILSEDKPAIVHIFGTEFPHSLSMVNVCLAKETKYIISMQGMVSIIAKHYTANLPMKIQKRFTLRDFLKQDNILQQQKKFIKRGLTEIEAIQKTGHVIGRTTWDKACTFQINPEIHYHFCNEILREEFYKHEWSLEKCEQYSIFISQAHYPIKGVHYMIEAMPLILKSFPKAKLYIAGHDITSSETFKDRLTITSYSKYIIDLIQSYNINKNVFFTGLLDEKQMCEQYLKANVFVCPSSIENSPNSLGEAMILGVPCVASDVGGISDMIMHNEEGFIYQPDAPYMLAYYVCKIFEDIDLALSFSRKAREHALRIYDKEINGNQLIRIYKNITKIQ
ncbi:MAG: glycosyltransferase family 4 protein [Clostridiaceae bacterium]